MSCWVHSHHNGPCWSSYSCHSLLTRASTSGLNHQSQEQKCVFGLSIDSFKFQHMRDTDRTSIVDYFSHFLEGSTGLLTHHAKSGQAIAGHTHCSLSTRSNFESPIDLNTCFLDCGGKAIPGKNTQIKLHTELPLFPLGFKVGTLSPWGNSAIQHPLRTWLQKGWCSC